MPVITWVRAEFVWTPGNELAMNAVQLPSSFTSEMFVGLQSPSQCQVSRAFISVFLGLSNRLSINI